jgi:hypothetical protein
VLNGVRWRLAFAAALPWLAHCADPIDAPPAFSGERYLCGPDHAAELDAQVEECRMALQTSVCRGVLSVRGNIDSEDVTLDARIVSASHEDWGGDPTIARTLALLATSPYFTIKLDVFRLAVPPAMSISGALPENCAPSTAAGPTPCLLVNLEARGGNYLSAVKNVVRTIELEAPPEIRASFSGELVRGGYLEGCFHAIVPTVR